MSTLNSTHINEVVSIQPQIQLTTADCAVACVAMLTGRPYADVFQGSPDTAKVVRKTGAFEKELKRLAKGVGVNLKRRNSEIDLDGDTGILWLGSSDDHKGGHAAVLFRGVLIDPGTGQLWSPEAFLGLHPHYIVEAIFEVV